MLSSFVVCCVEYSRFNTSAHDMVFVQERPTPRSITRIVCEVFKMGISNWIKMEDTNQKMFDCISNKFANICRMFDMNNFQCITLVILLHAAQLTYRIWQFFVHIYRITFNIRVHDRAARFLSIHCPNVFFGNETQLCAHTLVEQLIFACLCFKRARYYFMQISLSFMKRCIFKMPLYI